MPMNEVERVRILAVLEKIHAKEQLTPDEDAFIEKQFGDYFEKVPFFPPADPVAGGGIPLGVMNMTGLNNPLAQGAIPSADPKFTFTRPKMMLPNGIEAFIDEWSTGAMRSAFVIEPWSSMGRTDRIPLFSYGRSMPIPGTSITATRAHTNIPRCGDNGLPMGWEMLVGKWRANINVPLDQPVMDWAATVNVAFHYNAKRYAETTLLDLILNPEAIGDPQPIHLRENIGFGVDVEQTDRTTHAALCDWLSELKLAHRPNIDQVSTTLVTLATLYPKTPFAEAIMRSIDGIFTTKFAALDVLAKSAPAESAANVIRELQAKIRPGRSLMGWVHLEGPLRRVIV
jgi:hypothetical protein